jgi:hypothetical protein
VRQRNYGFERRRKADAKRAKQLAKQERKKVEGDPPGPDMGEAQDSGVPAGLWEWFSPSRSRVVTTRPNNRPPDESPDDWVLLTEPAGDDGAEAAGGGSSRKG